MQVISHIEPVGNGRQLQSAAKDLHPSKEPPANYRKLSCSPFIGPLINTLPHQAVVLWKSGLQQLPRLPTLTQQQQDAAGRKIDDQLGMLSSLEAPLPRSVWKQLIRDVQVSLVTAQP